MQLYTIKTNGVDLTFQLSDQDAKNRGLFVEPEANAEAPAPANTESPTPVSPIFDDLANAEGLAQATK